MLKNINKIFDESENIDNFAELERRKLRLRLPMRRKGIQLWHHAFPPT